MTARLVAITREIVPDEFDERFVFVAAKAEIESNVDDDETTQELETGGTSVRLPSSEDYLNWVYNAERERLFSLLAELRSLSLELSS
jgi:hypothetical protein